MLLTIFVITILCFAVAYKFYGGFQSRFYDLDPNRKTPATELQDDIDYCPAHPAVLMGHHFASIAGAGPCCRSHCGSGSTWLAANITLDYYRLYFFWWCTRHGCFGCVYSS